MVGSCISCVFLGPPLGCLFACAGFRWHSALRSLRLQPPALAAAAAGDDDDAVAHFWRSSFAVAPVVAGCWCGCCCCSCAMYCKRISLGACPCVSVWAQRPVCVCFYLWNSWMLRLILQNCILAVPAAPSHLVWLFGWLLLLLAVGCCLLAAACWLPSNGAKWWL